jgi:protein-S-isoprenylcysteine O-methyltransferase Ste14
MLQFRSVVKVPSQSQDLSKVQSTGRPGFLCRGFHGAHPLLAAGARRATDHPGIGKIGWQAALEISFLFGLVIWLLEVLLYTLHAPFRVFPAPFDYLVLHSPLARGIGACLVLAGFVLFIWALASFGASWRVGIDKQSPGALVTTGVFALSRNPIFVFVDLYFIGTFLLNGAVIFLMAAVLVVVGLHVQILQEEHFLRAQYGQAYREYCARAPRYLRLGQWKTHGGSLA